ncbi:MAG: Wzz/FepE/Etk N-terminal domain-containing protein [Sulfuricurvum sp.]|nr:Wzz/FepE/Etk N-terminal domain-containing protein [Sulfuricurvum sp.]
MEEIKNTPIIAEDEIDLRELAATIKKNKKFILSIAGTVTILTLLWTLTQPNQYNSSSVIIPQDQPSAASGGLSALAGLAGIDVGGGSMGPDEGYQILLNNYPFMKSLILKHGFDKRLTESDFDKNYVFALNIRALYNARRSVKELFFPRKPIDSLSPEMREKILFLLNERISNELSVSTDKKTGTITISCTDSDPLFAKDLVEAFLQESSAALKKADMTDLQNKLDHYQQEMALLNDITVKTQVSQLMSALIQTKVQADACKYYNVKMITEPSVAYVRDKAGPKRGLIIVVSFITSMIMAIFWVFFREFIRKNESE